MHYTIGGGSIPCLLDVGVGPVREGLNPRHGRTRLGSWLQRAGRLLDRIFAFLGGGSAGTVAVSDVNLLFHGKLPDEKMFGWIGTFSLGKLTEEYGDASAQCLAPGYCDE